MEDSLIENMCGGLMKKIRSGGLSKADRKRGHYYMYESHY
jgi:hypothetical protein